MSETLILTARWGKPNSAALETYLAICPSNREERADTYRCEPYIYAQMIAGPDAATPGEAKNSWLTGPAAWTFVSGAQEFCNRRGMNYLLANNQTPVKDLIGSYLRRRGLVR